MYLYGAGIAYTRPIRSDDALVDMMFTQQHDRAVLRLADMAAWQRTLAARPVRLLLSGLFLLCCLLGQIQLPAHALTHLQDHAAALAVSDALPAAGAEAPDAHGSDAHHAAIAFCDLCAAGQPAAPAIVRLSPAAPLAPPGLKPSSPAALQPAALQRPLARAPPVLPA